MTSSIAISPARTSDLENNKISQVSDTSRSTSTQMSIGGDSTLSTSVVPVGALGYSSQAEFSLGGVSVKRPVQDPEPNIRLAAFKPISSSTAGVDKHAFANPGARPAATKGQPQSTAGISKGQYTYHPHRQSSGQHHAAQNTAFGSSPSGSYPDDQSPTAAGNLQSGSHSGEASDIQHASEEQPQPNGSEGAQAGQLESAQSSNGVGDQGYQQCPTEAGFDSSSSTATSSRASNQNSSASSTYNAFNVTVGSGYDQLANSGPAAIAENPNALAQFVRDRLANQTDAQREALRSDIDSQFAKFVDDLFAAPASAGQPGSQQTAAAAAAGAAGSPPPQDLADQTCSRLGEMHEQLITNVFFMEMTIQAVLRQYTDVRDVIVQRCQ